VAYRYRDNYPSNKIDILHHFNQECCPQHVALNAVGDIDKGRLVERDKRRAISSTFNTPAGKVTLIVSNCPDYRVDVLTVEALSPVHSEGGHAAQIFSTVHIVSSPMS